MSRRKKRTLAAAVLLIAALAGWDIHAHRATIWFVGPAGAALGEDEPIRVEGLPIIRPNTITLGEGHPTVAVAASIDAELAEPAPLDATLSYDQLDAVVSRALDLDRSGRSLRDVIEAGDEVLIKVNNITNRGNRNSSYHARGFEHPGQITDLRVVKSVISYLVRHVGPERITIVEGGSQSPRKGAPGFPTNATNDSWSVTYPEFDGLSYEKILEEFAAMEVATVVDTADLNYAPFSRKYVPGGAYQRLGVTRLNYPNAQQGFHVAGTGRFRDAPLSVPTILLEADKVISLPAMKTHVYGPTLGIKNFVGALSPRGRGTSSLSKGELFQFNPEHGQVDIFTFHPADYTILQGFWGTEGDGPQDGVNIQHNVVVAGADPVATEALGSVAMGYNPLDLELLYLAAIKGFGTFDLDRIEVVGRPVESVERDFVKSRIHTLGARHPPFYGRGIRRWLVAGPFPGAGLDAVHLPDEADLRPVEGQAALDRTWTRVEHLGYSAEVLDLGQVNGEVEDARPLRPSPLVHADRAMDGFLALGYGDLVPKGQGGGDVARVWLNGEVVHDGSERRGFRLADRTFPPIEVHLRRGENRLLFKVGNFERDAWLAAHLVDADGDRLFGIEYALTGEDAHRRRGGGDGGGSYSGATGSAGELPQSLQSGHPCPFRHAPGRPGPPGGLRSGRPAGAPADGPHRGGPGRYEVAWDGRRRLRVQRRQRRLPRRAARRRRPALVQGDDPDPMSEGAGQAPRTRPSPPPEDPGPRPHRLPVHRPRHPARGDDHRRVSDGQRLHHRGGPGPALSDRRRPQPPP